MFGFLKQVFSEVCHRLVAESSYRNSTLTSSSSTAALPTDQPTSFFSATTAERSTLSSDRKFSDPQPLRKAPDITTTTTIKTEASIIPLSLSPSSKTDSKLSLVTDKTPVGTPNAARKNKRRSNLFVSKARSLVVLEHGIHCARVELLIFHLFILY